MAHYWLSFRIIRPDSRLSSITDVFKTCSLCVTGKGSQVKWFKSCVTLYSFFFILALFLPFALSPSHSLPSPSTKYLWAYAHVIVIYAQKKVRPNTNNFSDAALQYTQNYWVSRMIARERIVCGKKTVYLLVAHNGTVKKVHLYLEYNYQGGKRGTNFIPRLMRYCAV